MSTTETLSYFESRMQQLGITPDINQVTIWQNKDGADQLLPVPIFKPHEKGIEITPYTLRHTKIRVEKDGSKWKKDWSIIRHERPIQTKKELQIRIQHGRFTLYTYKIEGFPRFRRRYSILKF